MSAAASPSSPSRLPRGPRPPPRAADAVYTLLTMDPHRRCDAAGAGVEPAFSLIGRDVPARALVVITAYNEDAALVGGTLHGLLNNVAELRAARAAPAPPRDARLAEAAALAPAELVVLLIFDGRAKMHESHLAAGGLLGPAGAARMAEAARGLPRRAPDDDVRDVHLFELSYAPEVARSVAAPEPLQLLVAVKESNGGKLNSHAWAFRAIAPALDPEFLVLLDAGTVPEPTAVLRLLGTMLAAPDVGGACGEICVAAEQRSLLAPVVMAQVFEYTAANAIDKAFESTLGFIGVLPGAFSAYRAEAIAGAPLDAYFLLEDREAAAKLSTATANMYLAEDRILGFEIVAKAGCAWRLAYDAGAAAHTDVPDSVGALVKQRRRWLNGSFFATLYALSGWARILPGGKTRHGLLRQAGFAFLGLWHVINVVLAWFTLGNTYFALRLVLDAAGPAIAPGGPNAAAVTQVFYCVSWAWQLTHVALLIWSLGNRADESLWLWSAAAIFFGVVGCSAIALVAAHLAFASPLMWGSGLGALAVYLLCGALQGQLIPLILSLPHYILSIPLFTVLIPIYSWSNTHDLSWGTRPGGDVAAAAAAERTNREFRSRVLASWITCNWLLAQALSQTSGIGSNSTGKVAYEAPALLYYGYALALLSAFSLGARVAGCLVFVALEAAHGAGRAACGVAGKAKTAIAAPPSWATDNPMRPSMFKSVRSARIGFSSRMLHHARECSVAVTE